MYKMRRRISCRSAGVRLGNSSKISVLLIAEI